MKKSIVVMAVFCMTMLISIRASSQSDSLVLYIFLLDDCPICLDYTTRLKELHSQYGEKVTFVAYFPNFSSKQAKIENFSKKYDLDFPMYTDYYKTQAMKWGATITPEVVLVEAKSGLKLYQGRIDNKFVKLGKRRNVITSNELEDAIIASLSDKDVHIDSTEAVGCYINFNDALTKINGQ